MGEIKQKLDLNGRNRLPLALFYVNHILPTDMLGKPFDLNKPKYTEPGEKLQEWRAWAEQIRAELWKVGGLRPRHIEAVMLLTNPENAALSDDQLGALMEVKISAYTYRNYLNDLTNRMTNGGRPKLSVVATLAPLGDEGMVR